MANSERRTAAINLRAHPNQRALIDKAALIANKNRSDFMLEAACREAENILLDKRLFLLDDADYEEFNNMLNAPIESNPGLQRLLSKKSPWEK